MPKVNYATRLEPELLSWLVKYAKEAGIRQVAIVEAALIAYRKSVTTKTAKEKNRNRNSLDK